MAEKLKCPECGTVWGTPMALGSHRWRVHGVKGSSTGSKAYWAKRKRKNGKNNRTWLYQKMAVKTPVLGVSLDDAIGVLEHEVATIKRTIAMLKAISVGNYRG